MRNPNKEIHFYLCQAAWYENGNTHCRCANLFDLNKEAAKDRFLKAVYENLEPDLREHNLSFLHVKEIEYDWFVDAAKFYLFPRTPLWRRLIDWLRGL